MVMKSPIGLIFCRNMLMDSLQGQLKNGLAEVIFHRVICVKLLSKKLKKHSVSSTIVQKRPIRLKSCRNMLMGTGTVKIVWLR